MAPRSALETQVMVGESALEPSQAARGFFVLGVSVGTAPCEMLWRTSLQPAALPHPLNPPPPANRWPPALPAPRAGGVLSGVERRILGARPLCRHLWQRSPAAAQSSLLCAVGAAAVAASCAGPTHRCALWPPAKQFFPGDGRWVWAGWADLTPWIAVPCHCHHAVRSFPGPGWRFLIAAA